MFTNHTRTHRIGVCLPLVLLLFLMSFVTMAGEVAVTSVTACQRYPWNGLVDIVVTIEGTADDVSAARYKFLSTNSATNVEIPVEHITRNGADIGSGNTWTSRFVWDAKADVGAVKIEDVLLFVGAKILGGVQLWENGPCWAECNVGATQPEECGYYFWWGDTVGYERVGASWNASNGSRSGFSFKEGNCSTYGSIRTSDLLATQDAATVHLGAPWRMPTSAELVDLFNNCTTSWTMRNGVYGRLVTGKGAFVSKSIFLPAAGYGKDTNLVNHGSRGYYWTSTPSADDSWNKWCSWLLKFDSSEFGRSSSWEPYRYCGQSVRPLRGFNDESIASASGVVTHLALDCREGVRKAAKEGECLHYDVSWYEKAAQIRISDNEKVIGVGTIGDFAWHPELCSSTRHLVKLEALNGDLVVATETIEFEDNLLFEVKSVKAHQRYPWNGLVDIVMEIEGSASDVESAESSIVATVGETGEIIPVEHITRNGGDVGSYGSWTRSFIWNAAADVSADRVEDVVLTADARMGCEGVRLWENGPYWAECNVGAKKPDEAGYRFWWGDTIGYIRKSGTYSVDWSYKWYKDVTWVSSEGYSPSSSPFSSSSCSTCRYDYRALQSLGYIDGAGNLVC